MSREKKLITKQQKFFKINKKNINSLEQFKLIKLIKKKLRTNDFK